MLTSIRIPEARLLNDYGFVRENLAVRLMSREEALREKRDLILVPFLDMYCAFYYSLGTEDMNAVIMLLRSMMDKWDIGTDTLYEDAVSNSARILPPKIGCIHEMLPFDIGAGLLSPEGEEEDVRHVNEDGESSTLCLEKDGEDDGAFFRILTNTRMCLGASAVLYPGVLREAASSCGGSLLLLPSSIHEFLLLPAVGNDPEDLQEIVMDVNRTQLMPGELLSNSVYFYDAGEDRMRIIVPEPADLYKEKVRGAKSRLVLF